jgi:hypothetical protein
MLRSGWLRQWQLDFMGPLARADFATFVKPAALWRL